MKDEAYFDDGDFKVYMDEEGIIMFEINPEGKPLRMSFMDVERVVKSAKEEIEKRHGSARDHGVFQ